MTERQKQHLGRSEGDETVIEGRDIKAGALKADGQKNDSGAVEGGAEGSEAAIKVEKLLEKDRKESKGDDR